ncbi:MAG: hypothetical protein JW712_11890 [Dehalococcoidales bacterium]|nr:hypothetical protein [Dehalococcoidales bacterium]
MHTFIKKLLLVLLLVILLAGSPGCTGDEQETDNVSGLSGTESSQEPEQLPDLIIESVTYASHVSDSMSMTPGLSLTYMLSIRNIGNTTASGDLYFEVTRSGEAFRENYYESGGLLKDDVEIEPGGILKATCINHVYLNETDQVRFIINPISPLKGMEFPYIDESNPDNNTYELVITVPIPSPPVEEEATPEISKYTSNSNQYFVTGEPRKYTVDELVEFLALPLLTGSNREQGHIWDCLTFVSDYLYTFPGYGYRNIDMTYKLTPTELKEHMIEISAKASGISYGFMATEWGEEWGDTYDFTLLYNEDTREVSIYTWSYESYIFPRLVYSKALALLKEHPVYRDFADARDDEVDIQLVDWFDEMKKPRIPELDSFGFTRPVEGIVVFRVTGSYYKTLNVYVNPFNGEIVIVGPFRNPPQ